MQIPYNQWGDSVKNMFKNVIVCFLSIYRKDELSFTSNGCNDWVVSSAVSFKFL